MEGIKPIIMRLKIEYQLKGDQVTREATVNNFPKP